jgi:hypothetical protein
MEKLFEIASRVSTPLALAGVVVIALFLVCRDIVKKLNIPKNRSYDVVTRVIKSFFVLGILALAFGLLGYAIRVFSSEVWKNSIYRVRVVVLDAKSQPVSDARIASAPDGKQKQSGTEYEIELSDSNLPKDRKLRVWATREDGIFAGTAETVLKDDYNPLLTIRLGHETSARIKGQLYDEDGQAIVGTVYLENYPEEKTKTDIQGRFDLPAHAAPNEFVHLFVDANGYQSWNDVLPAGGESPAKIVLTKKKRSV